MAPESYSPNMAFLYQAYRDTDGSDSTTDKNLGSNVIVSAASYTVTNGGAPVFDKTVYLNMALVPDGDTLTIYEVNFADSVTQAKSNYVRQTQIDNVDTSLYVIELQKTAPTLTGDYDESQANPSSVDDSTFVTALLNVQNLPTTIPGDSTGTPGDGGSSAAGPGAQLYAYIVDDTVGNSYTIYQESALGQSFTWGGYRGRTANEIFLHLNKKPSSTTTYTVIIGIGNGAQPATYTYKYGEVKFSALTGTTIQYTTVGFTSSESPIVDWNSMTDVLVTQGTGRKPLSTGTLTINNLPEYDGTTVTAQYSTFYVVQGVLANSEDAKIWGNEPQVIGGGTVFESGPPAIEGGDAMEESGNTNWYTADNSGTFAVVFDVTEDVIREGLEYPDHENYQVYVNNVVFSNGSGTLDFKNAARLDASSDKIIKDALTIQNAPTNLAAVWVSGAGSDGRWKRLAFAEASVSVDSRTGVMTWMDAPLKSPVSLSWYANSDNTYPTDGKYTVEFWLKDNYLNYQNHTGSTSWSPDKTISNVTFAGGKATVNYTLTPGQADITITGIPDGASVYIVDPSSLPNSLITSTGTTINDNDKALFSDVFSKNPTKMIAVGSQSAADTAKIYFWDGSASITAGNYAVVVWPINSNTIYYQNSVSFAADGSTTATITYNGMTAVKISSAQSEGQKGDR
ncbi:MAG: hypothetical protein LBM77_11750 [Spirochaetaceae bacterium]|nr:hypothetical protein [Spirochaetaceae bacterium]